MSRTRLAAALGVAALTLGATAAVADTSFDDQTVTINVVAADRSVTVDGTVAFTVNAGQTGVDDSSQTSTISFTNPAGNDEMKIRVGRSTVDIESLELAIDSIQAPETVGDYTVVGTLPTWTGEDGASTDVITGIPVSADESNRTITWNLSGDAPSETATITTLVSFTVMDE